MLAETSRTTTPLDDAGSSDPASAGCRNELTKNAADAAIATPASASLSLRTRAARRSNEAASPSGIEVDDTATPVHRRHARHGRRASLHQEARAPVATTRRRRQCEPAPARQRPATPGLPHACGRRRLAL